ncbi:hypothetical protein DFP72DRAFT_1058063 [Ephemerocybe angulata]|uniref:Uncharacterized protein n=1 Tax=Ephemerocybe angulata TaxID=980116 RepID=A0A8H6IJA6_9AGAR|nr:hypothetical protein DFP72DRAFT_1058063 [Tulosesus angulatus]
MALITIRERPPHAKFSKDNPWKVGIDLPYPSNLSIFEITPNQAQFAIADTSIPDSNYERRYQSLLVVDSLPPFEVDMGPHFNREVYRLVDWLVPTYVRACEMGDKNEKARFWNRFQSAVFVWRRYSPFIMDEPASQYILNHELRQRAEGITVDSIPVARRIRRWEDDFGSKYHEDHLATLKKRWEKKAMKMLRVKLEERNRCVRMHFF